MGSQTFIAFDIDTGGHSAYRITAFPDIEERVEALITENLAPFLPPAEGEQASLRHLNGKRACEVILWLIHAYETLVHDVRRGPHDPHRERAIDLLMEIRNTAARHPLSVLCVMNP